MASPSSRAWPRRITSLLSRAAIWFVAVSLIWVAIYRVVPPPITFTMIGNAIDGRPITKDWMSLSRIDPNMARAAIGGEDWNFCRHHGFDFAAIQQAMKENERGRRIRGGSTISQQTAKNAFLWQGGGFFRKGLETWFTALIELIWGKHRIMEVYLNIAETGIGTYGANAGALRYFRHDASHLSTSEAARIAAVLPQPKKREAVAPSGFTRRHGNKIAGRVGVVKRSAMDACLR